MEVSQPAQMRELHSENAKLKRLYAELVLVPHAFQDAVAKNALAPVSEDRTRFAYALGTLGVPTHGLSRDEALALDARLSPADN